MKVRFKTGPDGASNISPGLVPGPNPTVPDPTLFWVILTNPRRFRTFFNYLFRKINDPKRIVQKSIIFMHFIKNKSRIMVRGRLIRAKYGKIRLGHFIIKYSEGIEFYFIMRIKKI